VEHRRCLENRQRPAFARNYPLRHRQLNCSAAAERERWLVRPSQEQPQVHGYVSGVQLILRRGFRLEGEQIVAYHAVVYHAWELHCRACLDSWKLSPDEPTSLWECWCYSVAMGRQGSTLKVWQRPAMVLLFFSLEIALSGRQDLQYEYSPRAGVEMSAHWALQRRMLRYVAL
jgi:hypothetical protein